MKILARSIIFLILLFTWALLPTSTNAQAPKSYTDYRKQVVALPLGDLSFADKVVSQAFGTKKPKKTEANANNAIGAPNYREAGDGRAFTLGCRGQAVFEFTDNALVDTPGVDLHIFEVGRDVEPTHIELSRDGKNWISIGKIAGGRTSIDLADYGLAGQDFRFVRVTDAGEFCSGDWPGADIDAIAAVGSAIRFNLSSKVLFDFDKAILKEGANFALQELLVKIDGLSVTAITIAGHTDARGSNEYNQKLSERRAAVVADFLRQERTPISSLISSVGLGETEPVADNTTDTGRARNRRVEVIVVAK